MPTTQTLRTEHRPTNDERARLLDDSASAPAAAPPSGATLTAGVGLVALLTVIVLECVRVLFSVGYHLGDEIGWITGGSLVVALFAAPALAPVVRRLVGPDASLPAAVAAVVAARVGLQIARPVPFWLASVAAGIALVALTLGISALRSAWEDGTVTAMVAVGAGVALDVVVRSTGATWDVPWRGDPVAVLVTAGLLVALAGAAIVVRRARITPADEDPGGPLTAFLLWPYLYVLLFTTQSPAFLDATAGVPLGAGTALVVVDAVIGLLVLVAVSRIGLARPARVLGGVALAGCAFVLPTMAGAGAVLLAVVTQVLAAALLGAVAGAERGARRPGIVRTGLAAAGGAVLFAAGVLVFVLHTIQPLPVTNRVVPALLGVLFVLAATARPVPARRPVPSTASRAAPWAAAAAAVLGMVSAAAIAATAPTSPSTSLAASPDGTRALRVMTFNIDQGVTEGQLDLEQLARHVESADPDVLVVEEVARGWSLSGMTDQAEWLGRRLGMAYVWSPAADAQFGNVVLSRLPIDDAQVLDLGRTAGTQARSFVVATLDAGGGQQVVVLGGHLQNGDAAAIHDERAASYRTILAAWAGRPRTILLGDLNTYPRTVPPGWPELDLPLGAGFHTSQDVDRCTVPTSNQNCPDWIFTSPDLPVAPVQVVVDRPDHRPIAATVTLPPPG